MKGTGVVVDGHTPTVPVVEEAAKEDGGAAVRREEGRGVGARQRIGWIIEQRLREERPVDVNHRFQIRQH